MALFPCALKQLANSATIMDQNIYQKQIFEAGNLGNPETRAVSLILLLKIEHVRSSVPAVRHRQYFKTS